MTNAPWPSGESPEEKIAREEAYRRLSLAATRAGYSLERLHELLRMVARNEEETRRFLAEEVYHVNDDLLDDLVRVRLGDLHRS